MTSCASADTIARFLHNGVHHKRSNPKFFYLHIKQLSVSIVLFHQVDVILTYITGNTAAGRGDWPLSGLPLWGPRGSANPGALPHLQKDQSGWWKVCSLFGFNKVSFFCSVTCRKHTHCFVRFPSFPPTRWHRIAYSVEGQAVTLYLDCVKHETLELRRGFDPHVSTEGVTVFGTRLLDEGVFEVGLLSFALCQWWRKCCFAANKPAYQD